MYNIGCLDTEMHFSTTVYETIPANNILLILKSRVWESSEWNIEQVRADTIRDIKEGINFLNSASEGLSIVKNARQSFKVSGNSQAVFAYLVVLRARLKIQPSNKPAISVTKLMEIVINTLKSIYDYKEGSEIISPRNINLSIALFESLANENFYPEKESPVKNIFEYA